MSSNPLSQHPQSRDEGAGLASPTPLIIPRLRMIAGESPLNPPHHRQTWDGGGVSYERVRAERAQASVLLGSTCNPSCFTPNRLQDTWGEHFLRFRVIVFAIPRLRGVERIEGERSECVLGSAWQADLLQPYLFAWYLGRTLPQILSYTACPHAA